MRYWILLMIVSVGCLGPPLEPTCQTACGLRILASGTDAQQAATCAVAQGFESDAIAAFQARVEGWSSERTCALLSRSVATVDNTILVTSNGNRKAAAFTYCEFRTLQLNRIDVLPHELAHLSVCWLDGNWAVDADNPHPDWEARGIWDAIALSTDAPEALR